VGGGGGGGGQLSPSTLLNIEFRVILAMAMMLAMVPSAANQTTPYFPAIAYKQTTLER
jgi:hypothetical protein